MAWARLWSTTIDSRVMERRTPSASWPAPAYAARGSGTGAAPAGWRDGGREHVGLERAARAPVELGEQAVDLEPEIEHVLRARSSRAGRTRAPGSRATGRVGHVHDELDAVVVEPDAVLELQHAVHGVGHGRLVAVVGEHEVHLGALVVREARPRPTPRAPRAARAGPLRPHGPGRRRGPSLCTCFTVGSEGRRCAATALR